jgi:uncharacterized protein (DUF58 family)
MIVPTPRLIICYVVLVPSATLLPLFLGGTAGLPVFLVFVAVIVAIAAIDGVTAYQRVRGVAVHLPETVRLTKGREGRLPVNIDHQGIRPLVVRVGLLFPPEIAVSPEYLSVELSAATVSAHASWPCTGLRRGTYRIDRSCVEARSLLGLWGFRRRGSVVCAIRVYPNLAPEGAGIAALFLNRADVGVHARRAQGKGREFERLREYMAGDGYDEIHWKATAKRHRPITKVFQVERTQEIYVIIDSSRLSGRPSRRRPPRVGNDGSPARGGEVAKAQDTQLDRFVNAALVLGQAARRQGDLFGLLAFSDSVHHFVRAAGGKSHYGACRDYCFNLLPRPVAPDYEELFSFVRMKLKKRALLMVLTSLDDPILAESFMKGVDLVRRHHLVLTAMFRPDGARPIFSHPLSAPDDIYGFLAGHTLWHDLRETGMELRRRGVQPAFMEEDRFCADLVSRYMAVKQRQIL